MAKAKKNSTVSDETQTQDQTDAATPAPATPAPKPQKPKAGKVEVSADATPNDEAASEQRLADARQQALDNHNAAQ